MEIEMSDESYLKEDLIELRKDLHLTQQQMADKLDMAPRAYQSIEAGESEYRYIHRLAVERVALQIAADRQDPMLAPAPLRRDAIELVRVGQLSGKPEFRWENQRDAPSAQIEGTDPNARFRAAYAVVGELVAHGHCLGPSAQSRLDPSFASCRLAYARICRCNIGHESQSRDAESTLKIYF
jgi:transcriptional regulator with XRE-family HTH domain